MNPLLQTDSSITMVTCKILLSRGTFINVLIVRIIMWIVSSIWVKYLPYICIMHTRAAGTFTWGSSNLVTSVPDSLLEEPGTEATKLGTPGSHLTSNMVPEGVTLPVRRGSFCENGHSFPLMVKGPPYILPLPKILQVKIASSPKGLHDGPPKKM